VAHQGYQSVVYGNSQFVVVDDTSPINRVLTSTDGTSWTGRLAAAQNKWRSVTYGNGVFVAVSDSTSGTIDDRVMTSTNGTSWTARRAAANNNWQSVTYGTVSGVGTFVAVGASGAVMTSINNGETWTARTAAAQQGYQSVVYGNGLFVSVNNTGAVRVMISTNGTTWTTSGVSTPLTT
jgi:hypothetical protein